MLLLSFLLSAGVTLLFIPSILSISFKKNLFDVCEKRKIHTGIIPRLGGVSFVPSILIAICLILGLAKPESIQNSFGISDYSTFLLLTSAMLLLFFEGIMDDLINLNYKIKFIFQITSASLVVMSGLVFDNFFGLLGIDELNIVFSKIFSVFFIVYLINALNFIDGLDGIASGLTMIALSFIIYFFRVDTDLIFILITSASLGSLIVFYWFNVFGNVKKQQKIFMGDCGSQTLGLIIAILIIHFSNQSITYTEQESSYLPIALGSIFIILMDMIRVISWRIAHKLSPFVANNVHIIHKFMALNFGQRETRYILFSLQIIITLLNSTAVRNGLNINLIILIDFLVWIILNISVNLLMHKKQVKLPYKA